MGAALLALASLGVALADSYPSDLPPGYPPTPQPTATPLPPVNPGASPLIQLPLSGATPTPTPGRGRRGRGSSPASSPSPAASGQTPAPPQFTTLDGTWEVEVQMPSKTLYSHWDLRQTGQGGADISGIWDRGGKPTKKDSLTGTFDGRLFKFSATQGGTQYTFTGYVENYSDIVGMMSDGKNNTPFTAEHRKKEKGINQINPAGIPGLSR